MSAFIDLFSDGAGEYAEFRPTYPEALFDAIASRCAERRLVWDCATGSGQAAGPLARRFDRVVATDASTAQLANARREARVHYLCSVAEKPALARGIADCVTVAQAAHWLDHAAFNAAVHDVAVPGALVVLWSYGLSRITPAIDATIEALYAGILSGYWAPGRRHIDEAYRTIPFPYEEIAWPAFSLDVRWTATQFIGYVSTWSAVRTYRRAHGDATLKAWRETLRAAWGDEEARTVWWPLAVRAGYVRQGATLT